MPRYTYARKFAARCGDEIVTVPDDVAANQRRYAEDSQSFPVILPNGRKAWMIIDADATGLFTSGTGDLVLRKVAA